MAIFLRRMFAFKTQHPDSDQAKFKHDLATSMNREALKAAPEFQTKLKIQDYNQKTSQPASSKLSKGAGTEGKASKFAYSA